MPEIVGGETHDGAPPPEPLDEQRKEQRQRRLAKRGARDAHRAEQGRMRGAEVRARSPRELAQLDRLRKESALAHRLLDREADRLEWELEEGLEVRRDPLRGEHDVMHL